MGPVGSTILSHVSSLPTSFDVLLLASIYLLICRCKYTTSTYHYGRSKNGIVKFDLFFLFFVIYYFKKCILIIEAELLLGLRHGSCWRQGLTVFQVHPWGRRACLRSIGGQEWWVPWPWATLESKLLQRFGLKRQKKPPIYLGVLLLHWERVAVWTLSWERESVFPPWIQFYCAWDILTPDWLSLPRLKFKECRNALTITDSANSCACMFVGLEKNHSPPPDITE